MKFKFDKNLDYQIEAIKSIVDIFDTGKNIIQDKNIFEMQTIGKVVSNELEIDKERILSNVQVIQENNKLKDDISEKLKSLDFSIEMETGTGKTYVYLRTIFELNQKYDLKKFIILVPSVAIREGVLKTLEQTKQHFRELFNTWCGFFAYDSKKLFRVAEFVQSLDIQIMVMTIQSFNNDTTIMRQTPDRFNGESPLELVASTKPVIIMDEPQNMESELSQSAIAGLNSLFKLRYSATHKNKHNLMYVLSPVDAYKNNLVKRIQIYGVEENDPSTFIFTVKEIKIQRGQAPTAKVNLEVKIASGEFVNRSIILKVGDDLFLKTKRNDKYTDLTVNEIDAQHNRVELSNGIYYKPEEIDETNKEAIFKTQIRETIKAHFDKQEELGKEIKVLSLFFIDKVDNYIKQDGIIRSIFEDEFEQLKENYDLFKNKQKDNVHNGYFAKSKIKGETIYKNTTGKTKADKEVYDLIMKDKEKLLSFEEETCFIFSHSALKEGWDNPNIFQICTLKETYSEAKKRQEIGRGLRLAVNKDGDRIFDLNVNILTVIPNESYKEYVGGLQTEYTDAGYREIPQTSNARQKVNVNFRKNLSIESEDFKKLWSKIKKRTKFNIEIKKDKLVKSVVEKINEMSINNLIVNVEKIIIDFDKSKKMKTIYQGKSAGEKIKSEIKIYNIIDRIVRETKITKKTIYQILSKIDNLDLIFKNPEEYVRSLILYIENAKNELLINEGLKYFPVDNVWEISLFENFKSYKNKTIKSEKSVYERVVFDSQGEKEFAEGLEISPMVKLFTKLPPAFVIDTPLGTYNPDWAIVIEKDNKEKLYLVRETKFINDLSQLRINEKLKIICGEKHFSTIGVDFKVSQDKELRDLVK
jgi:type III restriction enzyme